MFGLKETLFGIVGLVGLGAMCHFGLKYYTTEQLLKHGKLLTGAVVNYRAHNDTHKKPSAREVDLRVRYQGCQGPAERDFVVWLKDKFPQQGEVRLMSDGKCPETVVLRDAENTAWKETILGGILTLVGIIGAVAGLRRKR